jgi:hypothetical protein
MYRGTYSPEFYRTLHALVHAEFRGRRAIDLLARLQRRPLSMTARAVKELASGALQAARQPFLRRKVHALAWARVDGRAVDGTRPTRIPLLSQQAAAVPTEQRR